MTIAYEEEIIVRGKKVRFTKVISDSLGLFGKPTIRISGEPLYIIKHNEEPKKDNPCPSKYERNYLGKIKNCLKKARDSIDYGLGYSFGTNKLSYGYILPDENVLPLKKI